MLLKRIFVGLFVVLALGATTSTAEADVFGAIGNALGFPLRWVTGQLVQGGVDKLKAPIDDLDTRLKGHESKLSELIGDLKGKVDDSVDTIDRTLEARLLQFKTGNDDTLRQLRSVVDGSLTKADAVGVHLITTLDAKVQKQLAHADKILQERTADIDRIANGFVAHADEALENRIAQLDEAVGRRLGNVDAIADKQRSALERSLIRVAVMIGAVAFVVFVVRELWRRYNESKEELAKIPGHARVSHYAGRVLPGLLQSGAAALAGAAVLYGLYVWLPREAEKDGAELTQVHVRALDAAVLAVDYPRARLHASQLEFLSPDGAARATAKADKTALMRDLVLRPTFLATPEGVAKFMARLGAVERGLGSRPDADALTLHAVLKWSTGGTRNDEHEAASLAARALRLSPRGFAMAPLAKAYVQTFLDTPYLSDQRGAGREAATKDDLAEALAAAGPDPRDSPFEPVVLLSRLTRDLELATVQKFVEMVDAHARGDLTTRTAIAEDIVKAWVRFDNALENAPALTGSTILNVFRLNDAIFTHARWFIEYPTKTDEPKRLEDLPSKTKEDIALKLRLLPPRIVWARRYEAMLKGPGRLIAEFEEAQRYRTWERWTIEFEKAMAAHAKAVKAKSEDEPSERWRVVVAASALSLYVDGPSGRVPYAANLAGKMTKAPTNFQDRPTDEKDRKGSAPDRELVSDPPATLEAALLFRSPRVL